MGGVELTGLESLSDGMFLVGTYYVHETTPHSKGGYLADAWFKFTQAINEYRSIAASEMTDPVYSHDFASAKAALALSANHCWCWVSAHASHFRTV